MLLHVCVHVPANLLILRHWQVEFTLWHSLESIKFLLQYSQIFLCCDLIRILCSGSSNTCWLLSDCNNYKMRDGQKRIVTVWHVNEYELTMLWIEVKVFLQDAALVLFTNSFYPACINLIQNNCHYISNRLKSSLTST